MSKHSNKLSKKVKRENKLSKKTEERKKKLGVYIKSDKFSGFSKLSGIAPVNLLKLRSLKQKIKKIIKL